MLVVYLPLSSLLSTMRNATLSIEQLYAPISDEMSEVVRIIDRELDSDQEFVRDLAQVVQQYRGKMLRPAILLLTGSAFGNVNERHHTTAAILELIHLASLVHDDVLDESELRRSQPTINALHGNETAVMLGDWLFGHAYRLCHELNCRFTSNVISETAQAVCEGELIQLRQRGNFALQESEYLDIIGRKTAALTGACSALGAWHSGADETFVKELRLCGINAGMAFQIVDDILDLVGTEKRMGKTLGRDIMMGKPTLPLIHCLCGAPPELRERLMGAIGADNGDSRPQIASILQEQGSLDYARSVADGYVKAAIDKLSRLPESQAKVSLAGITEFIVNRDI